MDAPWDCVVVGAGIEGSCTAYHLAKNGQRTLLIEQFFLPHSRGSSHGPSRIIRHAYAKHHYVAMMDDAYKQWLDIQRETGIELYKKCGLLWLEDYPATDLKLTSKFLGECGFTFKTFKNMDEFGSKYPMLSYPDSYSVIFDEGAGVLLADKCLGAIQGLFTKYGGTIKDGSPVTDISPGHIITVTTPNGSFRTRNLVITAGPWTNKVLKPLSIQLPLKTYAINVCYWKEKTVPGKTDQYGIKNFHCFIDKTLDKRAGYNIYGMPCNEYPNHMKLCFHGGTETEPDSRDLKSKDQWDVDLLSDYVRRHFPFLETKPSIIDKCMYTMSPDEDFILDAHPKWQNIVVGAAMSGHGFKLGPVVGRVLSEKIMGKLPTHDVKRFAIKRFEPPMSSL